MSEEENMVLRTVYLPVEIDDWLKRRAYTESTTKGALIRKALERLMETTPNG